MIHINDVPGDRAVARDISVTIDGRSLPLVETPVAVFGGLASDGPVEVQVRTEWAFDRVVVRPLRLGITPVVDGRAVRFTLPAGERVSVEFDDRLRRPVFLLGDAAGTEPQVGGDVRRYAAGRVYDEGVIRLQSNQTIVIEPGAILRAAIVAEHAENVTVCGGGILDGGFLPRGPGVRRTRMMTFDDCRNVRVDGITVLEGPVWNVTFFGCDGVHVRDVKVISWEGGDDGFDVVGSQNVVIERCFARTKDDCVAIKAMTGRIPEGGRDVRDVRVERCVFWNAEWGNALEIGYETQCESMSGIVFRDIDVIRSEPERWTSGGVLTIHNGDRADIHDVLYDDIRIEDAGHKLIDFKITVDQYTRDPSRGQIHDVTIRNVRVIDGRLPPSIVQGFDPQHKVRNVTIENLVAHGEPLRDFLDARMITERWENIRFT